MGSVGEDRRGGPREKMVEMVLGWESGLQGAGGVLGSVRHSDNQGGWLVQGTGSRCRRGSLLWGNGRGWGSGSGGSRRPRGSGGAAVPCRETGP